MKKQQSKKNLKVLVVGGGSGGHITPAMATIREVLQLRPGTQIEFWTDRKYYKNVVKITTELGVRWGSEEGIGQKKIPYIRVRKVLAGKFHRYAAWTWKDYFKYWQVTLKDLVWGNIIGFCGFVGGILQSLVRLWRRKKRPDVVFLKGGFVGLPVGLVARAYRIPYVVHESDTVPGLANRILMKHAAIVASGWDGLACGRPVVRVGIPVASEFKVVSAAKQAALKKELGFDAERPLVMVTGGSQGSENINQSIAAILPELLKNASVGLVAGRKHYEQMVELKQYEEWDKARLQSNFRLWEFSSAMQDLLGAADVVVSRAGATTVAELAALKKAVILIPYERLPGGHQMKNAEILAKTGAVEVLPDAKMLENPQILLDKIQHLVRSPKERERLAGKLHAEAKADAAKNLARVVVLVGEGKMDELDTSVTTGKESENSVLVSESTGQGLTQTGEKAGK